MKAVLMTDVFQSLLMFAAVYSIIIYAAIAAGGLDQIWYIAEAGGRIEFFKWVQFKKVYFMEIHLTEFYLQ